MKTSSLKRLAAGISKVLWTGLLAAAISASPLSAADPVWTGGGGDANWSTAANWDTGVAPVPANTDSVTFNGTTQQTSNNDLGFGYYTGITFANGGFTMNGMTAGLTGNIASTGENTISSGLVLGGGGLRQISSASGTLTIDGSLNFQGLTLQDNSAGTTVYNTTFNSAGAFRVFSTGQTVLGGDNSGYDGAIQVFRFAKLTHASGLGGASTTTTIDRSYGNAAVDLNGLAVSGVNVSFTAAEVPASAALARLRNTSATAASFSGNISLAVTGGVDGTGDITLSGTISGSGTGLVKEDAGTLRLTGANTFTGGTSVNVGTLLVNNTTGSATGTGAVDVSAVGAFGGTGSVSGAVTLNNASIRPGDGGIGTLSTGTVTWNGGVNSWLFDLSPTPGTSDLLSITGDFTKGTGSLFSFDFQGGGAVGVYTLATWTGSTSFTGTDFSYANLAGTNTAAFNIVGSQLQLSVIPEPSTWALLTASLFAVMILRPRRRV